MTAISPRASIPRHLRLVSLMLFLTVFSLPLHFHPVATTPHVTKECSCIHGSRIEMGLAPVQADWLPPIRQIYYKPPALEFSSELVGRLRSIRAPPVS